jgi:hypothetical protein
MSRSFSKICIIGALLASAIAGASSASAAEWHTNGSPTGTTFDLTAGASRLNVTPVGGAVQGITCSQSTLHIHLFGPTIVQTGGSTLLGKGTPTFNSICQVAGQTSAIKCTATSANVTGVTYTPAGGGITTGNVTGIHCVIVKTSGACGNATTFTGGGITVTGSVQGTFTNSNGQLTVSTANQTLGVSWSSTGCLQGTGTGTASSLFTNASGTDLIYSPTPSPAPRLTLIGTGF